MSRGDIAVIGMAARFPGARDVDQFWANVRDGVESIRPLTRDELLAAGVPPSVADDPAYVAVCPVLDGIDQFDAGFFGFSPRDAAVMDPAHRLFLEVAWEAMEHAGHTGLPGEGPVGVFAGSGAPYYLMDHVRRNEALMRSMGEFLVRHTNNDMNFLSTRVSYEMDLRGPSVNVQTACSTALVSVHMACESIRQGECTLAIAGGATVLIPDRVGYLYHEGEILSPDGHCRPFDERSAGTVFGSGVGAVVLKSLSAALDDGDTIHAVIKASAINNDGALRVGFLAPGVEGQAAVVGRALDLAGVPADSITYIEAHGTGTSVGDPIEVAALNQAFRGRTSRQQCCAIGSVKSNIGHLGEAAGAASLIKAIMALKHAQLPPTVGFERPNPQIDFEGSPFFVNSALRPWSVDGPRRCGVTALGAGGTNCHMILEQAPEPVPGEGERPVQLLVLSARTQDAVDDACEQLADALTAPGAPGLADTAYTLAMGRRALPIRTVVVARDHASAAAGLRERNPKQVLTGTADDQPGSVVFMFPGGGAQYPRMGIDLYEREERYRAAVDECLAIVTPVLGRDLGQLMFVDPSGAEAAARELQRPSLTLPALFATEYALATLFTAWGVEPAAYLGHSMGEYVAACFAGVMTLDEALRLVMLRGRLFESVERGGMLSVPLSERDLTAVMPAGLSIAAVNAPELCVASGPVHLIDQLAATLAAREVETTSIHIDVAAHSVMLDPILAEFGAFCRTIALKPPRVPFLSNVTGQWITAAEATDPDYWVRHLRSTVRFATCLETLGRDRVLLEVGPGRTLSRLARAQAQPVRHAFNVMRHPDEPASDLEFALTTVGRLWIAGVPVEWSALYEGQLRNRVPLPTYPWQHARHWVDAPAGGDTRPEAAQGDGRRTSVADWFERPSWRQTPPPPPLAASDERVLVFADQAGFGADVGRGLGAAGRSVIEVHAGDAWHDGGTAFTVRPGVTEDFERLLSTLAARGGLPRRVVHAWTVTEPGERLSLEQATELGFHSLLALAQALASDDSGASLTLDVITSNLQRIGGESVLEPAKALVLGPARVMPRELPQVASRAIDIVLPPSGAPRSRLAGLVAAEVAAAPADETVAFRGLDRFVQVLEPVRLDGAAGRLRERGVYVITGAFGGIGYALATHLAGRYRARLVLIGRSATRAQAGARVAALEQLGADVELVQADVTDAPRVRDAIARARARFGALNGVFHAAGALGDSLMPLKTREDAERVLAPKVQGTLALDAAIGDAPLDLFVLFSSISAVAGLAGQADYTAANAFLDAFAHERQARDGALTIAVNWSAWREVGMAANIASGAGVGGGVGDWIHPVLGRRIWSSAEAELFSVDLSVSTDWVVGEHRLRGGRSLMPGTGYVEVARAALEARPEARAVEIRELAFMSAFVVPDEASREMRLHLSRGADGAHALVIAGKATADDGSAAWHEHVTATVQYVDATAPPDLDLAAIAARCSVREEPFGPDQQSVNMDFGSRWKNLRSIRYGRGEALVTLALPDAHVADLDTYRLHPALLDMATGRCEALVAGFEPATDFYVPLSYTRLRMFAPLAARIVSHVRVSPNDFDPRELIVFNVTITDEAGRVLVDIEDFVMTRVTDRAQLDAAVPPVKRRQHANFEPVAAPTSAPPLLRWMHGAIASAEGLEAIERIAAGPAIPQVFATPQRVSALIAEMRQPSQAVEPARPDSTGPALPLHEVESALGGHEAVHECVVLQRRNRPGELKLVAYVTFAGGEHATVSDLRRFLRSRLPDHLVPSAYFELDELPRLPGGQVNEAALPDPFGAADDYVAPRTETEARIADIWKDVLGLPRVSVYDNFFDAGGHSLLAVRVVVRIDKTLGVRLNQAVMVLQTLEQIAAECDRRLAVPPATAEVAPAARGGLGRRILDALRRE